MSERRAIPPQFRPRPFGRADWVILALASALAAWLIWRLAAGFKYDWRWGDIPSFIIRRGESGGLKLGPLGQGFLLTLKLSLWASALALITGLALALGRLSGSLYFQLLSRSLTEVSRNIPPLVLIFIGFYFLSSQLLPWPQITLAARQAGPTAQWLLEAATVRLRDLSVFFPAVVTLALYEAAYFSEIFRGAISAVSRGQWEASWCLGLSRAEQYRFVILPQVFRRTAPQLAGQFISTVKESSIVSVLSLAELTYSSMKLSATYHHLFEIWLSTAAIYFLFNFALSSIFRRLEN